MIQLDGPEIVDVDIDTYKIFNPTQEKLELIINTCWFSESQIITNNVSIEICWHGYIYNIPINAISQNFNCCDNTVLKINLDLINNTISYDEIILLPVITSFGLSANSLITLSYGYIKMFKEEYLAIAGIYGENEIFNVQHGLKTIQILNIPLNNKLDIKPTIDNYIMSNGLLLFSLQIKITNINISSMILSDWEEIFILNNKKQTIFNIAQVIIDYKG